MKVRHYSLIAVLAGQVLVTCHEVKHTPPQDDIVVSSGSVEIQKEPVVYEEQEDLLHPDPELGFRDY